MERILSYMRYGLRKRVLEITTHAGSGHPTSCLSAVELLIALFGQHMRRGDRFVLSKGHAVPLLYVFYELLGLLEPHELDSFRQFGSRLEGHPSTRLPYIHAATGSLGQGLSIGLGMTIAQRIHKNNGAVFVLLGDSELTEGSNWEAAALAAHYTTNNLIALVDHNRWGQSTDVLEGHESERIAQKFVAFGWHAHIVDGHDLAAIIKTLEDIRRDQSGVPQVLIAHTSKGHGLNTVIEDHNGYHGKAFKQTELPALYEQLDRFFPGEKEYHLTAHDQALLAERAKIIAGSPAQRANIKITHEPIITGDIPTRRAFGQALTVIGSEAPDVISFDAEVKNSTGAELFEQAFPERFVQCYVAEQNMMGMAVGAAQTGCMPVASTFAAFTTRAYDQLRMASIGRVPFCVVGSHAGVSIGEDGPSQMGLEDIACMRALPGSIVLQPCDSMSTGKLLAHLLAHKHASVRYMRTLRGATPQIYQDDQEFSIGGCTVLKQSEHDVACVIASGVTVFEALKAYDILQGEGVAVAVVDAYSIKPLAQEIICSAIERSHKKFITVEDHYAQGGLGEAVLAAIADQGFKGTVLAVPDVPCSGTPEALRAWAHIDAQAIVNAVKAL